MAGTLGQFRKQAAELKSPANLQQNHGWLQVRSKSPAAGCG
jgi:hypothetical protein